MQLRYNYRVYPDASQRRALAKAVRHPLVGELTLSFETFSLADGSEQALITHHAEPGSPSAEALRLLGSWGADATRAGSGTSAPSV